MNKQKLQFSKFITPGDFVAVIVIIIGIITAMVFEEIAIRMIGVSIAILGAVALFMLISQRLSEVVETRYSKPNDNQPEFKMTTIKDSSAKRQTVEDFVQTFGGDDDFPVSPNPIQKPDVVENTDIKKSTATKEKPTSPIDGNNQYHDGFSGMRIVGKVKPNYKDTKIQAEETSTVREVIKPVIKQAQQERVVEVENNIQIPKVESEVKVEQNKNVVENEPIIEFDDKLFSDKTFESVKKELDYIDEIPTPVPVINIQEVIPEPVQIIQPQKLTYSGKIVDLPLNVLMETDVLLGDEPRKEFEYFLTRVLTIIRSSTDTRSALFFLFNSTSQELILESYVTSIPLSLKSKLRFELGNDIISQIVSNSKPQILSEINPAAELDLIPYYNSPSATSSLIGVPVFWGEGVVGVLIADSDSPSAYDSSTVAFLGHFTKLVGAIVKSYTHKFDLLQASKALEAINMFYALSNNNRTESDNMPDRIADSLKNLFPNASVGLCGYDSETDTWQIKSYRGNAKDLTGIVVNIEESILGRSIYDCKTYHLNTNDNVKEFRVHPNENKLNGQFICSPIKSSSQIYGAIFVELNTKDNLSEFDVSVIELIGDHAGNNIERIYLSETLKSSAVFDHNTGLLNPIAFYGRIQEELARANDFKTNLTLCLFKFDKYSSLDPNKFPERFEYAEQLILQRIRKFLKEYDIYGNVSDDTFGIVFIGKDSNQSRLIAERIRADVANTLIEHGGGRYSTTISLGCCSPSQNNDIDLLIQDTIASLNKAYEVGNQVQVLY
jgi:GGDEF domain-containing protein/putative methionine-R-sulfoxide reductase with GAF domain